MPDRVLHTKLDGPGLFLFEVAGQDEKPGTVPSR
jgi:hypothetical protein